MDKLMLEDAVKEVETYLFLNIHQPELADALKLLLNHARLSLSARDELPPQKEPS